MRNKLKSIIPFYMLTLPMMLLASSDAEESEEEARSVIVYSSDEEVSTGEVSTGEGSVIIHSSDEERNARGESNLIFYSWDENKGDMPDIVAVNPQILLADNVVPNDAESVFPSFSLHPLERLHPLVNAAVLPFSFLHNGMTLAAALGKVSIATVVIVFTPLGAENHNVFFQLLGSAVNDVKTWGRDVASITLPRLVHLVDDMMHVSFKKQN